MIKVKAKSTHHFGPLLDRMKDGSIDVEVGYFQDSSPQHEGSEPGISVAQVAAMNEFGTKQAPPRPFMSMARADYARDNHHGFKAMLSLHVKRIIRNFASYKTSYRDIAKDFKTYVHDTILNGTFAPLRESTVLLKGHNQPLIDTYQMINSVEWRNNKKGGSK